MDNQIVTELGFLTQGIWAFGSLAILGVIFLTRPLLKKFSKDRPLLAFIVFLITMLVITFIVHQLADSRFVGSLSWSSYYGEAFFLCVTLVFFWVITLDSLKKKRSNIYMQG